MGPPGPLLRRKAFPLYFGAPSPWGWVLGASPGSRRPERRTGPQTCRLPSALGMAQPCRPREPRNTSPPAGDLAPSNAARLGPLAVKPPSPALAHNHSPTPDFRARQGCGRVPWPEVPPANQGRLPPAPPTARAAAFRNSRRGGARG